MKRMTVLFSLLASVFLFGLAYAQPTAPVNLTAKVQKAAHFQYISLTWDYSKESKDIKFTVYKKKGGLSDEGSFGKVYGIINGRLYIDKNIAEGQTYSYYVAAVSKAGQSTPSDTIEISAGAASVMAFLTGSVTDEETGVAIKKARVMVIPVEGWHGSMLSANDSGYFSCKVPSGSYILQFSAAGYTPEFYENAGTIAAATKITLKGDTVSVIAALKKYTAPVKYAISGTVKDSSGKAVKARITAYILNSDFRKKDAHAETDSAGAYTLKLSQGDSVVVYAEAKSKTYLSEFYNDKYELSEADKLVISGDLAIDFVLREKPVYSNGVAGMVSADDSVSTPLKANITLFKAREDSHGRNFRKTTMSDSLGNYSFTNLEPGKYIALAVPMGKYLPSFYRTDGVATLKWKQADTITVNENSYITGISFKVVSRPDSGYAIIKGHVKNSSWKSVKLNANTDGVSGAIVYATDENSNTVNYAATDGNGDFIISGLEPGNYTLTTDKVAYAGSISASVAVDYSTNFTATQDLTLTPETVSAVSGNSNAIITDFALSQNYPNPFNPSTLISYQLPKAGMVTLKVYNIIGQEIATLVNEAKNAGQYSIRFDGTNLTSGIYLYKMSSGNVTMTKKMILMK